MIAEQACPMRDFFIIRDERAGFAVRAQVLSRVKTETAGVAHRPHAAAFIFGAMGLSGVFDNQQVMALCNFENWIQVGRLAVKMHRNNSSRSRINSGLDF